MALTTEEPSTPDIAVLLPTTTGKPHLPVSLCHLPTLPSSVNNFTLPSTQFPQHRHPLRVCAGLHWRKTNSQLWRQHIATLVSTNKCSSAKRSLPSRYVCRVACRNQTFPGELNSQSNRCLYTNHLSHEASNFQVLVNPCSFRLEYVPVTRPRLPECAVIGGVEQRTFTDCKGVKREKASYTFIGRTVFEEGGGPKKAGKVTADRLIYYSSGNGEALATNFEVLVLKH
ncbi:hypothetical protein TYRP_003535 [Tyrophagus putrescentiae]|nr:hypothetical protein TYRP_003535 [Tyrophagus putrescentiae]